MPTHRTPDGLASARGAEASSCTITMPLRVLCMFLFFFFFNDPATTEIYTLSLHDALPICLPQQDGPGVPGAPRVRDRLPVGRDRKSTRLNSSHSQISYAVFCLKKQKKNIITISCKKKKKKKQIHMTKKRAK